MNNQPKIWLGGITNSLKVLVLIEQALPYFDGLIFTLDDKSPQELFDKFKELKEKHNHFHYIIKKFEQAHDLRMDDFLHSGIIPVNSLVTLMDSTDRFEENFLKELRNNIKIWAENNINAIFTNRPFIFKFTGSQHVVNSPHWGISNLLPNFLTLENVIVNTRDLNAMAIEHPIKYLFYKRSNHTQLLYQQFGDKVWELHEKLRQEFIKYVEYMLGFECNVENLVKYLSEGIKNKNLPKYIIYYCDIEVNMQDLIRYYILKQDLMGEIVKNRFNWQFSKFYNEGVEHQNKDDGFIGVFNKYRLQQGKEME